MWVGGPPNLELPPPMASHERRVADEIYEGLLTCGRNHEATWVAPGIILVALALAGGRLLLALADPCASAE